MSLRFTPQDLALNRSGKMSMGQRIGFLLDDVRKLGIFGVLLVCFAACVNAGRPNPENHLGDYLFYDGFALVWLLAMIWVVIAAGESLRDALAGRVRQQTGTPVAKMTVEKPLLPGPHHHTVGHPDGPLITYELNVGGAKWDLDQSQYTEFEKLHGAHHVYYAAKTRRILSYEAAV